MKKISLLLFVLLTQFLFSQANRFVYQVTIKTDSTDRGNIKTETAYLDVTQGSSVFYSEKRVQRDSIFSRMRQTGTMNFDRNMMENLRSYMDYTIDKNFTKGTTTFTSRVGRDQYSYEEDRPLDWKILPETATIGEYKAQKAETSFGGRKWAAWFTTDLPFQDGPYKFAGLPGLIIKAEDAKGDYSFDLKETKKIAALPELSQRGNVIKVKRKDYEKQEKAFRKDPASFMQAAMSAGRGGISAPQFRVNDADRRKQMEQRMKEEAKKNNNPIEL